MATYTFTFPAAAAGRAVTIRDAAGSTVSTTTLGNASGVQQAVVLTADLAVGSYTAEAVNTGIHFTSRANGVLDVAASLGDALDRVATFVPNATTTNLGTVGTSINALRDALVAAGLMAAQ